MSRKTPDSDRHAETDLMHFAEDRRRHHGAVVPPIYQNSLFTFESWEAIDAAFDDRTHAFIYSRLGNPTVTMAEQKLARLAGGERARLFASGMAAVSAAVMHCLDAGDHVVAVKHCYGPASNLLNVYLRRKMGIEVSFVDGSSVEDFDRAITERTRLIYLESPSSAVFGLQDIAAVVELARARNGARDRAERPIRTLIDNTWATPIFQRPLSLGVDLELHSCSKYLCGHSDTVAGALIGSAELLESLAVEEGELLGAPISPNEAWLLARSLRTLPLRMRRHQESALAIARFLEGHPKVKQVRHPGLESHPQYALGRRQMSGTSGLMGFELATTDVEAVRRFFDGLSVFQIGVSWGGHESLVYAPAISYLKELPPERFAEMGIALGDMRISVGLEHVDDLLSDLEQALARI
jgi:cystathionine beta-lyase